MPTNSELLQDLHHVLTANKRFYVSGPFCTIQVNTGNQSEIVWTAPIAWKFRGQPLRNLLTWMRADQIVEIV
jgi:hypothetical protein